MTVSIRGSLNEVTGNVLNLSALGLDVLSPKRFPDSERVGLTIRSLSVRGPGCSVPGNIGIQREQPEGGFFIRIDFVHSAESQKNLQTFLWGVEEVRQTKRREEPSRARVRGPRTPPPVKSPESGRHGDPASPRDGARDAGKLPVDVTVTIRGSLNEVTGKVLDLSAMGLEVLSPKRFPDSERVGLSIRSLSVRGPGCSVPG
ncbi:MAG TPA: PilZ domain-containing protein, partial [Planctomycetota bacterium]|nr:PilZ domain-containing protein [Planctomycetota bacterium]